MTRPHHIATCTAQGDIIELGDEAFDSFEQAAAALRAQGYVKAGRNLWTSSRADGTTVHVCTVDMQ
jgi:hypothetical protein